MKSVRLPVPSGEISCKWCGDVIHLNVKGRWVQNDGLPHAFVCLANSNTPYWHEPAVPSKIAPSREQRLERALLKVREACLFADDDNQIGVTTEAHIPDELFAEICAALDAK
jgi:hypothetical protein